MLEDLSHVSCCAACGASRAINLVSAPAGLLSITYFDTPGVNQAISTVGQTFTTGEECVILSSFTVGLSPGPRSNQVLIRALLHTFDLSNNRVTGSPLASQSTSATQSQGSLTVTFPQPVQLSPADSYAIILTTAGLGQAAAAFTINVLQTSIGTPIPGGRVIYLSNGNNVAAIETTPFNSRSGFNYVITIS